ncbi:hypothetical protein D910_03338 [Dendroctonus ponderosae]
MATSDALQRPDYSAKMLNLLLQVKYQNDEILSLLKTPLSTSLLTRKLPEDIPVSFPIRSIHDIFTLEEYLKNNEKAAELASYCATFGGKELVSKVNIILKYMLSNEVAAEFSFLGTRNGKRPFFNLALRSVIISAISFTLDANVTDIDNCIKVWLKHAPRRFMAAESKSETI